MPGIRLVDAPAGVLGIEWIDGKSVRYLLGSGEEGEEESGEEESPDAFSTDESVPDETTNDLFAEYGVSRGKS